MNCTGIIAEWNPFHLGHCHLLEAARHGGATHIVAVMSGNYVQRGEAALCPKRYRVSAALQCGCDLVLELPLPYAAATAERFAFGGVALLEALGCVDTLLFGSEVGEIESLQEACAALESPAFRDALAGELRDGSPFAAARQRAAAALCGEKAAAVLSSPNNILAVEYLMALRRMHSTIRPATIARVGAGHDSGLDREGYASASLLRQRFRAGESIADFLPDVMNAQLLAAQREGALFDPTLFERPLMAALRRMSEQEYAVLPDLSEGLEHRLYRESRTAPNAAALLDAVKTKRYSHARLRRILLAAFLGIPADLCRLSPPYLRVLGMNERGAEILAAAKGRAALPVSVSLAELARTGEDARRFVEVEARATDLYNTMTPILRPCDEEYTLPFVKIGG